MKRNIVSTKFPTVLVTVLVMAGALSACSNGGSDGQSQPPVTSGGDNLGNSSAPADTPAPSAESGNAAGQSLPEATASDDRPQEGGPVKIRITADGQELTATLLDNATAKALVEKLPLTVPMEDLYSREMCYHFPDELPANETATTGYEVGEIIYWPPRHSLVIMYAQNGERFDMQKIGRIDSGVELFEGTGDTEVTFERFNE